MEACITPLPEVSSSSEVAGGELQKWPQRAFAVPPRISKGTIPGLTVKKFEDDNTVWKERIEYYKRIIPPLSQGRYRNAMDMNAYLGGFAAALMDYPIWVMNVVPANSDYDTLGVIYERGFIGTYQDWCEAFSTYPRTYDLIHASAIFSIYQDRYVSLQQPSFHYYTPYKLGKPIHSLIHGKLTSLRVKNLLHLSHAFIIFVCAR